MPPIITNETSIVEVSNEALEFIETPALNPPVCLCACTHKMACLFARSQPPLQGMGETANHLWVHEQHSLPLYLVQIKQTEARLGDAL